MRMVYGAERCAACGKCFHSSSNAGSDCRAAKNYTFVYKRLFCIIARETGAKRISRRPDESCRGFVSKSMRISRKTHEVAEWKTRYLFRPPLMSLLCVKILFHSSVFTCCIKQTLIWNWKPHYWHSFTKAREKIEKHDVRFPFTQLKFIIWQLGECAAINLRLINL